MRKGGELDRMCGEGERIEGVDRVWIGCVDRV